MLTAQGSKTSRAAAVSVVGYPVLALRSLSRTAQKVVVECLDERGQRTEAVVNVGPGALVLWPSCVANGTAAPSFAEALDRDPSGQPRSLGLSVTTNSMAGGLAVYGVGLHAHDSDGSIYAPINFTDPAHLNSSATVFTGVPVGPTDVLPGAPFRPLLGVSNFGNAPSDPPCQH